MSKGRAARIANAGKSASRKGGRKGGKKKWLFTVGEWGSGEDRAPALPSYLSSYHGYVRFCL